MVFSDMRKNIDKYVIYFVLITHLKLHFKEKKVYHVKLQ